MSQNWHTLFSENKKPRLRDIKQRHCMSQNGHTLFSENKKPRLNDIKHRDGMHGLIFAFLIFTIATP